MADLMASVNNAQLKENAPELRPGDSVRVHAKVVEGNRERIQVFEGVVIRMRKGGIGSDFTDGLHPNAVGYRVWRDALVPFLQKMRATMPAASAGK